MRFTSFLFVSVLLLSCDNDQPSISNVPVIEFVDFNFIDGTELDTLQLKFNFQDSNFDLGLDPTEQDPPYHRTEYFYLENGQLRTVINEIPDDPIKIGASDTLPIFDCLFYEIWDHDTIYARKNTFYDNIFFGIYDSNGLRSQDFYDALIPCQELNSRFPKLFRENGQIPSQIVREGAFEIELDGDQSGVMTFNVIFVNDFFNFFLGGKTITAKARIVDREFNFSNEIQTTEITFD
ncbi:MAG: hypothetical protein AAGC43_18475 [Bacteroidota bacterium]